MRKTPISERLQLAIFGRRNVGKSSLINALTGQSVALVSRVAGTTTDPVFKTMELGNLGPVVFIDTAGVDDIGELGRLRQERSWSVMGRADLVLLVVDPTAGLNETEEEVLARAEDYQTPVIGVVNKIDDASETEALVAMGWLDDHGIAAVAVSSTTGVGIEDLKDAIEEMKPDEDRLSSIFDGLFSAGETVVLVCPIDAGAPKGRLILPQMQAIRAALDLGLNTVVVRETELENALGSLAADPALVVTDSQAFDVVAKTTPPHIPLTSFSILMARYKGDLATLVVGVRALKGLEPGDRVLIAEACTHRPSSEDIGRIKIPRWLTEHYGQGIDFSWCVGGDFPADLSDYKLVIHCGACMVSRAAVLQRLRQIGSFRVPIVNYGVLIAHINGILERALEPFVTRGELDRSRPVQSDGQTSTT